MSTGWHASAIHSSRVVLTSTLCSCSFFFTFEATWSSTASTSPWVDSHRLSILEYVKECCSVAFSKRELDPTLDQWGMLKGLYRAQSWLKAVRHTCLLNSHVLNENHHYYYQGDLIYVPKQKGIWDILIFSVVWTLDPSDWASQKGLKAKTINIILTVK